MQEYRKLFSVHKRPTNPKEKEKKAAGKRFHGVFYVQFKDEDGRYGTARSTGQTSRGAAEGWAVKQLREGKVVTRTSMTLSQWVERAQWWEPGKCRYMKRREAEGAPIGKTYASIAKGYLKNHIVPELGNKRIASLKRRDIESFKMKLKDKKLSATSVNHVLTCLRVMLREAVYADMIPANPMDGVRRLKETSKERGILTLAEVKELFDETKIAKVWSDNYPHFVMNYVAAVTGMRLGELLGLQRQHVHETHIHVRYSWERKHGLKDTKTGKARDVPLNARAYSHLLELMAMSPYKDPEHLVFWGESGEQPIEHTTATVNLYAALKMIGIDKEERAARGITFHSWRHFLNTTMRAAGIPDYKIRLMTGHTSDAMTDRYDNTGLEQLEDLRKLQNAAL